ncbi:hypothetical protein AB0L40_20690 [Patulibacter sp. NPDC049589]|uniref:hypothetical protein n=1 Tax=Patulibacter sp. NPDC049589 TaxID=3154731 RepID=UPI0034142FAA
MGVATHHIDVAFHEDLELAITSYVLQGYVVQQRTEHGAVLHKPKGLNVPVVVASAVLCVIPLVVYLIVYALQSDAVVVISVGGRGGPAGPADRAREVAGDEGLRRERIDQLAALAFRSPEQGGELAWLRAIDAERSAPIIESGAGAGTAAKRARSSRGSVYETNVEIRRARIRELEAIDSPNPDQVDQLALLSEIELLGDVE